MKIHCESCGISAQDFFEQESDGSVYKSYDEFRDVILDVNTNDDDTVTWYCTEECFEDDVGENEAD